VTERVDQDAVLQPERVHTDLLASLDQTWAHLDQRLRGLTATEYLWEPAPNCWTVRDTGDGRTALADWEKPDPDPAPVTTIAWRMWHIAVDCLDGYSNRRFAINGTGLNDRQWVLDVDEAQSLLARAWHNFRNVIGEGGPAVLAVPVGPAFGPYADDSTFALALHAQHEVAHHGAEIALLRDLYAATR
jgi:DinB superfamily